MGYPVEIKKSQFVRLWDIFALGPAMVYIGYAEKLETWEKVLLIGAGIGTIIYNGQNYIANREKLKNAV